MGAAGGCIRRASPTRILSGLTPWTPSRAGLIALLLINLTLGLSLGGADRLAAGAAVGANANRAAPARGCMCGWSTWFGAIAVVPAILVAIFAAVTLNLGLDACSRAG